MTTPPAPGGAIEYVAEERTAGRLGRALLRYRLTRPIVWCNLAILGGLIIAFGIGVDQPRTAVLLLILLLPAVIGSQYVGLVRRLRRPYGPGTHHWALFRADTVTIGGPFGVTETRYRTFQRVWRTPDALVLTVRGMRTFYVMPGELAPAPQLAQLVAAVDDNR